MACGTSSSGPVGSELRSWRLRTASRSLRMPGESTLAPRSSNATDFSSCASQEVCSAQALVFQLGNANMLHAFEDEHQLPDGVARSEVGVTPESPSLAVVPDRQRMEA